MIKLDNLTKFYPLSNGDKHFVFREFTFTFPDDCSIGLIGRNGAGKSTLLSLVFIAWSEIYFLNQNFTPQTQKFIIVCSRQSLSWIGVII